MGMTQRNPSTADSTLNPSRERRESAEVEQTEVRVTQRRASAPTRLDLMLAHAQMVITRMAPADPRARLLHVAMLRRDEILLEALLKRLDASPY
jgi:hypothetical protein